MAALSERNIEAMRMAVGVLTEWVNRTEDFSAQEAIGRYSQPDAVPMILGGLIPIAGNFLVSLARDRNMPPEVILQAIAGWLSEGAVSPPPNFQG